VGELIDFLGAGAAAHGAAQLHGGRERGRVRLPPAGEKSPWRKAAPIWVFPTQLGFFDVPSIDGFFSYIFFVPWFTYHNVRCPYY
jgi:hypothetical protein